MTVLVAVASRHGATREIADAIGRTLTASSAPAEVRSFDDAGDLAGYEAFVLGSAVYMGRWLEQARDFVEAHRAELAGRPTWLFSSGPIGDPPRPAAEDAVQIDEIAAATGARDHRLFAGRLDKSALGFGERAMVLAFRVAEGDYRDWAEIEAWAGEIAAALPA
jgi:menaquinone-dependent protoporphyrinogen oxidase